MILGAGWAFLGLVVVGLAMLVLVPACGVVVVNEAPDSWILADRAGNKVCICAWPDIGIPNP